MRNTCKIAHQELARVPRVPLESRHESSEFGADSVGLLLIDFCGDDSRVLVAAIIDDTLVFGNGAVVDAWGIGGEQEGGLPYLGWLADAVETLDCGLYLGAHREIVDGRGQNKTFGLGEKRVEFLHVVFLDAGPIALAMTILAG